jgi:RNA polymerase sigma-70 factor (ECF subfamily)
MRTLDEIRLLLEARDGDSAAAETLVRRHGPTMVRTAWNVIGRYGGVEAEDVVQEALVAALTTPALPTGDVGAWLRAITARKALDWLRQSVRRREEPFPAADDPSFRSEPPASDSVLAVRRALVHLSSLDRAALILVDVEGFRMSEAAALLGVTTVAMKWRAVRARRKLRVLLETGKEEHERD